MDEGPDSEPRPLPVYIPETKPRSAFWLNTSEGKRDATESCLGYGGYINLRLTLIFK